MKAESAKSNCPLCHSVVVALFSEDKKRSYLRCADCRLVFVPSDSLPGPEEEKAIYDCHQNDVQDQRYRRFLSRLSAPLLERLDSKQRGLDFGCGPGPTLSVMLEEQGHHLDLYDPYYHPDPDVFDKRYDFICATEVVEHLHDPRKEFSALFDMLRQGGWLGIMTKMLVAEQVFSQWYYIGDPTHVCFYSRRTFEYLAQRFNAEPSFISDDVVLFNKK